MLAKQHPQVVNAFIITILNTCLYVTVVTDVSDILWNFWNMKQREKETSLRPKYQIKFNNKKDFDNNSNVNHQ